MNITLLIRAAGRSIVVVVLILIQSSLSWPVNAEITRDDREFVRKVEQRLLAVLDEPPDEYAWPPVIKLVDDEKVAASATVTQDKNAGDKLRPVVQIHAGFLKQVIEGKADRLALVMGHELGHVVLKHALRGRKKDAPDNTPLVRHVFSREDELAADKFGMQLALKAGYSVDGAIGVWKRFDELGLEYSSFEGLEASHPSWKERMSLIRKDQAPLWRTMAAFDNGVVFLKIEQYAAAERCFKHVTRDFPECHEGWANLGYARLMQYCDALESEDLRKLDVGQVVAGGFYRRPESLEPVVRGIDEDLWFDAVGALREALRLDPQAALVRADLGLAYLVHPAGKDVGRATKYLHETLRIVREKEQPPDPVLEAVLLINTGVAEMAAGEIKQCRERFSQAEALGRRIAGPRPQPHIAPSFAAALLYNRALVEAASDSEKDRREAVSLFEKYLASATPASAWWSVAYGRYRELCHQLKIEAKQETALLANARVRFRPVSSVTLATGETLDLSLPLDSVPVTLGDGESVPVVKGTNLVWRVYPKERVDLLTARHLLAIRMRKSTSPPLALRGAGLGSPVHYLRVGMAKADLDDLLGEEPYDYRQLTDSDVHYRFYSELGVAVRIRKGVVEELVVARIPRRRNPL